MARLEIVTGAPDITLDAFVPEYDRNVAARGISEEEFYANRSLPVLWLLHGAGGHSSDWFRYSQIELFAQEKGIIVACPNAGNGFYVNRVVGTQWDDLITDKLWKYVHSMLPTSDRPEDNTIAGLSMGGYGALRLGLGHPERYGRICCMSGGVEIPQEYAAGTCIMSEKWGFEQTFGPRDKVVGGPNDLYKLAKDLKEKADTLPPVYMCCGTRDEHEAESNPRFRDYLRSLGYDVTWDEGDYAHEWRFWNIEVEKLLKWLPDVK